nr:SDR family NAD(P)-dependent oxidoreductase [Sphingomonas formosensis]
MDERAARRPRLRSAQRRSQMHLQLVKRRSPINKRPSPLRNPHHPTLRRPRTENQNSATNATVVLVNNAGYGDVGSVEDTTLASFRRQIETNLFGTIIMTKAAIPIMREQRSGHIIQFSSVGGRIGAPGRAPYSAAKWGVEGFSEVLGKEMALIGVRVTIVEPGGFRTDFAGASTTIEEGRAEYDAVVGAAARMQRAYDGKQPGDPRKGAAVILEIAGLDEPPLRLPLGKHAVAAIEASDSARLEELARWRALSESTDFD